RVVPIGDGARDACELELSTRLLPRNALSRAHHQRAEQQSDKNDGQFQFVHLVVFSGSLVSGQFRTVPSVYFSVSLLSRSSFVNSRLPSSDACEVIGYKASDHLPHMRQAALEEMIRAGNYL